ncbi:anthranilate synthase component I family protein [Sandaracinomonas limnophila]|uniref:Anthranilate synthase component 1 n=1 Tax=Sandaracinomonas limnophila TaxID=1862386 RepID=A0A437PUG7_9BACT|nr:anthranilate synthase component I family protein [Sandaracinomonas limnophila]RVU25896.1 anthranilate synthase component I family protein [Sandaracinomonas limnophila]
MSTVHTFPVKTSRQQLLADTLTPVAVFLRVRHNFKNSVILESADYHGREHGFSHIAFNPIASFELNDSKVTQVLPDGTQEEFVLENKKLAVQALKNFADRFEFQIQTGDSPMANGLFGHISYDAVQYFEDIQIQSKNTETEIPSIKYLVYKYVIAINHFNNQMTCYAHSYDGSEPNLDFVNQLLNGPQNAVEPFSMVGEEKTNLTDDQIRVIVNTCIKHCLRGDVFQIVPSRRFSQDFKGDDFQVYRALRSVNPSPYMFYFDYENYRIFGASPEKQIKIDKGLAEIHPIAGTFRRSGDDEKDAELAKALTEDPKETAEHVMLVDLARNDLSKSADEVKVETFKEVQFFSHVIHLVSKVTGKMHKGVNPLQLVADTFPAGTLSGAPKHNAMTIINRLEPTNRHIYGGAIGFMDFDGNFNHAIAIRTFLSKGKTLFYQAGMGVVAKSNVDSEMQEIHNKLAALKRALDVAQNLK